MDEFELIDRCFRRAVGSGVSVGIGDDAAVLDLPVGRQLVAAVDTLIEGVHYPADLDPADIGYRAVAVNLSDLAAMGATPAWMTLALSIPSANSRWLEQFAEGLFMAAGEHGVALVGGDTTRARQTVISVQLLGHVAPQTYMTRSGCRAGDRLYVTGTPGDAAAGLRLVRDGRVNGYLQDRFRRPTARVAFGLEAARLASAAIDVSDGLAADLNHLLTASAVGATVDIQTLPLSDGLRQFAGEDAAWRMALNGGDDYELCVSVDTAQEAELLAAARRSTVRLSRIGVVETTPGLRLTAGGRTVDVELAGYRHF